MILDENIQSTAEFNSLVNEDAKEDADFFPSKLVNHSREQHHLPKHSPADLGKERTFFLTVLSSIFLQLV